MRPRASAPGYAGVGVRATPSIPLWHRRSFRRRVSHAVAYVIATAGAVVLLIPFFWMISSSLKEAREVFKLPIEWVPSPPRWENYPEAWKAAPFGRYLANTLFITVLGMTAELISATIVAYGFARYRFPGRDLLFLFLLSTMMLPMHVTIIPTYVIWRRLGLTNQFDPWSCPHGRHGARFTSF